jgi:hypothetical protein
MDEILEFLPGGPWLLGAVALLAIPGVRNSLRPLAKSTMKAGMAVADQVKALTAETREQVNDLYEEARSEYSETRNERGPEAAQPPASARSRRSESTQASSAQATP